MSELVNDALRQSLREDWADFAGKTTRDSVKLNARSFLRGYVNAHLRHDILIVDGQVVRTAVYGCSDA